VTSIHLLRCLGVSQAETHPTPGRSALTLLVLIALLGAASCSSGSYGSPSDGALRLHMGAGGSGLEHTGRAYPWSGTFGGVLLCTTGDPVTIKSVTYPGKPDQIDASSVVRRVTEWRGGLGADALAAAPISARRGAYDRLESRPHRVSGTFSTVTGYVVTTPCAAYRGPKKYTRGFEEVVTTLTAADSRGGAVDAITIAYEDAQGGHQLSTEWAYALCGTATETIC
jgi:hypothetical protein